MQLENRNRPPYSAKIAPNSNHFDLFYTFAVLRHHSSNSCKSLKLKPFVNFRRYIHGVTVAEAPDRTWNLGRTMTSITDHPHKVAIAAAQRLKHLISKEKNDIYLQQAMRSAHLVVMQSGILTDDIPRKTDTPMGFSAGLSIH